MTQEVLKMALEALETYKGFIDNAHIIEGQWHWIDGLDNVQTAIQKAMQENAMREVQRLGQEIEQEPVATLEDLEQEIYENTRQFVSRDVMEWMLKRYYTTPPQRTWVGLTDEDVNGFVGQYWGDEYMKMRSMVRAIEAKLKERNT